MSQFRIVNTHTGTELGIYEGENEGEALRAMMADGEGEPTVIDDPDDASVTYTYPGGAVLRTGSRFVELIGADGKPSAVRAFEVIPDDEEEAEAALQLVVGRAYLKAQAAPEWDCLCYYADETRRWYLVAESDVAELGARILRDEPEAYSRWAAETEAKEMPEGWAPSDC